MDLIDSMRREALDVQLGSPELTASVTRLLTRAADETWADRLFQRDTSLWSTDETVAAEILDRLGCLDAPMLFADRVGEIEAFGDAVRNGGFRTAVLAGMGGSSLAPDVLASVFSDISDWLSVRILDSTDPAAVAATVDDLEPLATLFIVASKSGTTTETLAFLADAWQRLEAAFHAAHAPRQLTAGDRIVAITDPGPSLEAIPHSDRFFEVFLNPTDVGGRYSALTYVGLVPASLLGVDLDPLVNSGVEMISACRRTAPEENPGLALGIVLGAAALAGRDKVTFLADPEIERFGAWAEQLLAESTGKEGRGIVPVDGEPAGRAEAYGRDRVFVRLSLESEAPAPAAASLDHLADELAALGHPLIRFRLADPIDLGGEFVRWEVATAITGLVMGVNPFDEPDVAESKENTREVLDNLLARGAFEPQRPLADSEGLTVFADARLPMAVPGGSATDVLAAHLRRVPAAGYHALLAFIAPTPERTEALGRIRALLRDRTRHATTAGYGPRYLHSTGQLHKGGPRTGCFIQLTADHPVDRPIPGRRYTFGQLIDAQAIGDFQALERRGLPVLRIHLGADPDAAIVALEQALERALRAI